MICFNNYTYFDFIQTTMSLQQVSGSKLKLSCNLKFSNYYIIKIELTVVPKRKDKNDNLKRNLSLIEGATAPLHYPVEPPMVTT